ncbi:unnamed protein product, partial [Mesorhabditis spiculigera]
MLKLLVFVSLVYVAYSCKCQTQTTKEAYCRAEWVSHLKVKVRVSKQPLPAGSTRKGLNNLKYGVEHVHVYKKPANMSQLPDEIFTPSESPACGLIIEAGTEYLLAGSFNGGSLYTVLCGQVLPDNRSEDQFENVLQWKKVPADFDKTLQAIKMREQHKAPTFTKYSRILPGDEQIHENILVNAPIAGPPCATVTTVWENLKRTVALNPDADFLGDQTRGEYVFKTYSEVMKLATVSGAATNYLGIQHGARAGLAGIHTTNYEIAMWGLVSQGISLVPLYHNSKDDVICEIIGSCNLELIFCDSLERLKDFATKKAEGKIDSVKTLILLNGALSEENNNAAEELKILDFEQFLKLGRENYVEPNPPNTNDVYIICHTSGTTGRPKGVQLTHQNLLAAMAGLYTQWCMPPHHFTFSTKDTYFSFLSLAHIYEHLMQSFMIYVGGRVGIYRGDAKLLILDIQKLRPTMISLVPRILNKLYDQIHSNIAKAPFLAKKDFRCREKVTPAVHDFTRIAFGCPLFEGYGQTECGAAGTLNIPGDLTGGTHVGAPAPWAQVKLIDVPEMGYMASEDRGEGWLHTGDIGEWLPDGRLRIVDRKNALFKLAQGDFVSAEAIENILGLSALVNQVFVTGLSTRSFLVGVAVVDLEALRAEIKKSNDIEAQNALETEDSGEFLQKEPVRRFVTHHLAQFGKSKGLQTIETIRRVFLTTEELTAESGLLTPTLKIRRQPCREKFAEQIHDMYEAEMEL